MDESPMGMYRRLALSRAERERDDAMADLEDAAAKDLDETRRLLYMVLFGGLRTERSHELKGTLANALVHHGLGEDFAEVEEVLTGGDYAAIDGWARSLIREITERIAQ